MSVVLALTIAGITHAAEQPACYLAPSNKPGLGDNMFTLHFAFMCKDWKNEMTPSCTPDRMRQMMQEFRRFSNGTPFVGWCELMDFDDVVRSTYPYYYEDTRPPWGDGTAGSGYRTYRELYQYAVRQGGHLGFYLNINLCTPYVQERNLIPDWAKALDKTGAWIFGWGKTPPLMALSIKNMLEHNEANGKSYLISMYDDLVNRWGANEIQSIHFDFFGGARPNESTRLGGSITKEWDEYDANNKLLEHLWNTYGISSCSEWNHNDFPFSCMRMSPGATSRDNTHTVIYMRRPNDDVGRATAAFLGGTEWGAQLMEYVPWEKRSVIRDEFYKYMLVYQYTQKTRDFTKSVQDGVTLYDGDDRFVPQVGAGCRIIAYSKKGSKGVHALPLTWKGIASADIYRLTPESVPALVQSNVRVSGSIDLAMGADSGYVIVPHGYEPTPTRVNFDELHGGDVLANYKGISWNVTGNPGIKVQARGPGSVVGGMGTLTMYMDNAGTSSSAAMALPLGGILHSLRVGSKGGTGTITIRSSNAGNSVASFSLPPVGQTEFIETNWQQSEAGNIRITVSCSGGVANVLLDDVVYGIGVLPERRIPRGKGPKG